MRGLQCGLKYLAREDRVTRDAKKEKKEFLDKIIEFAEARLKKNQSMKDILTHMNPDTPLASPASDVETHAVPDQISSSSFSTRPDRNSFQSPPYVPPNSNFSYPVQDNTISSHPPSIAPAWPTNFNTPGSFDTPSSGQGHGLLESNTFVNEMPNVGVLQSQSTNSSDSTLVGTFNSFTPHHYQGFPPMNTIYATPSNIHGYVESAQPPNNPYSTWSQAPTSDTSIQPDLQNFAAIGDISTSDVDAHATNGSTCKPFYMYTFADDEVEVFYFPEYEGA